MILKERKLRYPDLAAQLGLSLPTVKRMMADGDMPLARLLAVCDWLGLTLKDLALAIDARAQATLRFTLAQESFFATSPAHFAYFTQLLNRKPVVAIEKQHGISRKSSERYLRDLEKLGLVERLPALGVRLLADGTTTAWDNHGPLGKTYARYFVRALAERAVAQLEARENLRLVTGSKFLTEEQRLALHADLEDIVAKYRAVSHGNKITGTQAAREVTYLMIVDTWDDPFFREIPELE